MLWNDTERCCPGAWLVWTASRDKTRFKTGQNLGFPCKPSRLQCCKEQCKQAKKQFLPQSTSNTVKYHPKYFWLVQQGRISSTPVLLLASLGEDAERGGCLLTAPQPPPHSEPFPNGNAFPAAPQWKQHAQGTADRKKMRAPVSRGRSLA